MISDEQIRTATRRAVGEHGPGVSLDLIAERLGVSQPALLKRFGTRKDLMLAALRPPAVLPFEGALHQGPDGRPFQEQLSEVLGWLQDFLEEATPCLAALRESGIPMREVFPRGDGEPMPLRVQHGLTAWLNRCAERRLIPKGDFETIAFTMFASLSARCHVSHMLQRSPTQASSREFLASVADLFSRAIGAAPLRRSHALRHRSTA